jgi:hypothetical protein
MSVYFVLIRRLGRMGPDSRIYDKQYYIRNYKGDALSSELRIIPLNRF